MLNVYKDHFNTGHFSGIGCQCQRKIAQDQFNNQVRFYYSLLTRKERLNSIAETDNRMERFLNAGVNVNCTENIRRGDQVRPQAIFVYKYYSGTKKENYEIHRYMDRIANNHPEGGNSDPKRQALHVFSPLQMLGFFYSFDMCFLQNIHRS